MEGARKAVFLLLALSSSWCSWETHTSLSLTFQWFGLNIGSFVPQLLSCLEKRGLDTEGILRVPGSQTRVKVMVWLPQLTKAASPSILTCELTPERIQVVVCQCPGFGLCLGCGIQRV